MPNTLSTECGCVGCDPVASSNLAPSRQCHDHRDPEGVDGNKAEAASAVDSLRGSLSNLQSEVERSRDTHTRALSEQRAEAEAAGRAHDEALNDHRQPLHSTTTAPPAGH